MKKNLIYLSVILLVIFHSCNKIPDKSIFEPLSIDELNNTIKKDTSFAGTYLLIETINKNLDSDLEKAEFADLSYRRVHNYLKYMADSSNFVSKQEKIKKDWEKKFGKYPGKIDSISNSWKKYKEENSLNKYVKIELVEVDKEFYTYIDGLKGINLGFLLTPMEGEIEEMLFSYMYYPKNTGKNDKTYVEEARCNTTTLLKEPDIRYWEVSSWKELYDVLKYKNAEDFLKEYELETEIKRIKKEGKTMDIEQLPIPESVTNYWKYEDKEFSVLYGEGIIREILGEEYMSKEEYLLEQFNKILEEKDKTVYKYLGELDLFN